MREKYATAFCRQEKVVTAPQAALSQRIFLCIAALLGSASVIMSAIYAANRAIDLPNQIVWGAIGAALGLALLIAPGEAVQRAQRNEWAAAIGAVVLTVVAGAFVLTGALGNASGGRQSTAAIERGASEARMRAENDFAAANAELGKLAPARLRGELVPLITAQSAKIGAAECGGWVKNVAVRTACAERHALTGELARADRRIELETKRDAARAVLDGRQAQSPANSDAAVLSRLLKRAGIKVAADTLADVLTVIAVLAVEIGGAVAAMLARGQAGRSRMPVLGVGRAYYGHEEVATAGHPAVKLPRKPLNSRLETADTDCAADLDTAAADRRTAIIAKLKAGALEGRQSDIAATIGVPRTSLRRIVESEPLLRLRALPGGVSRLELIQE